MFAGSGPPIFFSGDSVTFWGGALSWTIIFGLTVAFFPYSGDGYPGMYLIAETQALNA